jgi:hypothetical protein
VHFDQYNGDSRMVFDRPISGDDAFEALIRGNFVGTCSNVIARRDLLEAAGLFDTSLRQSEDYDLWLRCALRSRFLLISEVMLVKVTHDTNLTNNLIETWQYHEKVLTMLLDSEAIAARPTLRAVVNRELSAVRYIIGNRLYNRGEPGPCFTYYLAALRAHWSLDNLATFTGHMTRKSLRLLLETLKLRPPKRDY